jgi:hypothetical protein
MKSALIILIVLVIFMFLVYSRDLSTKSNATSPQRRIGRVQTGPLQQAGIIEIINGNELKGHNLEGFSTCVGVKLIDGFISAPRIKLTSINGPVNGLRIFAANVTKNKFNLCVSGNPADLGTTIKNLSIEYVASGMTRK